MPRLSFGLTGSDDIYVPASGVRSSLIKLGATADYSDSKLKIAGKAAYTSGDIYNQGGSANQLDFSGSASYIFSRNLDARLAISYLRTFGGAAPNSTLNGEQSLNYSYYQSGGMSRKLFEVNEVLSSVDEYLDVAATATATATVQKRRANSLLLGAKYYPLRQMMVSSGARYSFVDSYDSSSISYYASLSLQFKLLEAGLDYAYGKSKADNRVEKKLAANIKKKF
jgi:hypothetical protein